MKNTSDRQKASALRFRKRLIAVLLAAAAVIGGCILLNRGTDVYSQIRRDGYSGTQEQWLVSLVGEDLREENAKSAYDLAVENGYTGSLGKWMKTVAGTETENADLTAYELAVTNGFDGSLVQWLEQLVENPDELGRSENPDQPTSYEVACQFGYSGTFLEWIVSVSHDPVTP